MKYRSFSLSAYERKLRADKKLSNDVRGAYFDAMAKLLCECQRMGVGVQWHTRAEVAYWEDPNVITLDRKNRPKTMVHDVLHELGHAKLAKEHRFQINWGGASKGVHQQLNALNEEFEAWHVGREFARLHKMQLDWRMLDRVADRNLMMYVAWAARRGSRSKRWV